MDDTNTRARVLVVDGDANLALVVETALQLDGMETARAVSAAEALRAAGSFRPHVIVIDVDLVDLDGFEVVRRLRESGCETPVIFLTARASLQDRLIGLSLGNDYMTKPFAMAELLARVGVELRNSRRGDRRVLRLLDLELDQEAHHVTRNHRTIALSPTEFRLLKYLLVNKGRVLSREQIFHHVWQDEFNGDRSLVETYISYLRRKIDRTDSKLIHTVRGVGYCLRADATTPISLSGRAQLLDDRQQMCPGDRPADLEVPVVRDSGRSCDDVAGCAG